MNDVLQDQLLEDERLRHERLLDQQLRIERLNREKAELQHHLDKVEAEAHRHLGKMEAERDLLKFQLQSKEQEISRQAKLLEDSGSLESERDELRAQLEAKDQEIARQAKAIEDARAEQIETTPDLAEEDGITFNFLTAPGDLDLSELIDEAFAQSNWLFEALSEADIDLSIFDAI